MENYNEVVAAIALAMGAGWASGLNLYATLLMLGFLGGSGNIVLPPDLQVLSHPAVMMSAGFMYMVEFVADKTPGVDTAWDALHTFVRIPAGAILAAGAVGDVAVPLELAAVIVGGGLAAGSHATKAGGRVLINTSPEPFSNWAASFTEDLAVVAGLWTALHHPLLFLLLLAGMVVLMAWLLPRLWRGIKGVAARVGRWFGWRAPPSPPPPVDSPPPAARSWRDL